MREMKDSGIDYIGEIPINMTVVRLKNIVGISDGTHDTPQYVDAGNNTYHLVTSKHINSGKIEIDKAFRISENDYKEIIKRSRVSMYDVIMPMIGTIGNPALVVTSEPFAIKNVALLKCSGSYYLGRYVVYLLNSYVAQTQFELVVQSGVQSFISQEKLKNLYFPFTANYKQIVDFLDSKCTESDSITSDLQSQIETLEEYKRSVITEAVTKGLDPDVEMRDSGIAWVGDIPAHWLVEKVKFHLQRNEPRNPGDKQVLSVYREYGVIPKDSRDDNHNVTSEDTSNYKYVVPGNIVINKMKAWQGSMGVSEYEGIVSPAYFIYKFTDNQIMPKYLHYLFRSCYKDEFRRISGGIREGQWDLSPYEFSNTLFANSSN